MMTRFATTNRRSPPCGGQRAGAPRSSHSASASPICAARPADARPRRSTTRRCCRPIASGRSRRRGAHPAQDRPAAVGRRQARSGRGALRRGAALLEGADAPIEQAHLWQERGRLAFRMGDHARAAKWADEALGLRDARCRRSMMPRCGRSRAGDCRSAQHQGCRAGAARAQPRGGARGRAQRRSGRGRRPAERGLPRLHQSRRALHDHRSGAGDGRLPARP